jgi:hypothetical protein
VSATVGDLRSSQTPPIRGLIGELHALDSTERSLRRIALEAAAEEFGKTFGKRVADLLLLIPAGLLILLLHG